MLLLIMLLLLCAADAAAGGDFWETVDPIGVLERMTYLNVET
jgi:hypothetical protein